MNTRIGLTRSTQAGLGAAFALLATASQANAQCLTTPGAAVGDAVFGATVQTFTNLGIDPTVTCISNGL